MLFTRTGDDGTSGLWGTEERLPKDDLVFEALGCLDELNSLVGVCRAKSCVYHGTAFDVAGTLLFVQECLFVIQASIAGAPQEFAHTRIEALEDAINALELRITPQTGFVISGATELGALLDYARAVSRRAERRTVALSHAHDADPNVIIYLNRLSSLLYALARYAVTSADVGETAPSYSEELVKR